jgi:hypothetical protein
MPYYPHGHNLGNQTNKNQSQHNVIQMTQKNFKGESK